MLLRNFSRIWRFCNSKQIRQGITKNGKDNLEVNQNTTTNVDVSNTSNDGINHIQKMNEGDYDRQNAYWAYCYIQKIVNCSDHNFPFLQQTLVNMKYGQLKCNEPINEKSHKYMKGFYDIFSKEGPLLDQIVFSQQRYQKGQGVLGIAKGRIVYYPTKITKNMFGLFRNRNTYAFVAGLRGIGKSFAIMQYCQLMNLITKYRIQMRNKKLEQIFLSFPPMPMDLKPFYWTIERKKYIEKESQAIQLVLNLWKIILAQCDSVFKQENKTEIYQLQKQLRQYLTRQQEKEKGMNKQQFHIAIQDIANKQTATKFKFACNNLQKLCKLIKSFYKKQNINIILFIDQINTLASIFRQTKQALQKLQTKKFFELESDEQKKYTLGRVYDDLRIVLNNLSDYFFHNSSADLEKCYKYDNRSQNDDWGKMQKLSKINLKMIYGNTHTNRQIQDLKFQSFFESQSYQLSMKNIFQFQLWKKLNISKQFYESECGKQIQQIVRKWVDEKLYLFKIQPLLIRQGLNKFDLNNIKEIFTNILKLDGHIKNVMERKVNNMSNQIVQNNSDIAKYYQHVVQVCKQNKVSQNILQAYENISQLYQNNGNQQNIAKAYYNLAEAFRNIQCNQNITQNYQNIAKAYQKGETIEMMKNIYENIINIYETIIDQNLLNLQEQLNVNFQVIQNKIIGSVQQDLKAFIAKNSTYVNQLFKSNTQLTLFFGTILKYLEMKLQMQQSKDDAKLQCLQIDLNKTNIFTELFKQQINLDDKIIKKYICNELFYCKNLVLKSYVGDKVLCKALRNIFDSQILKYNLFQNAQILTQITPLIRGMLGNFYEQLVLRQFSSCSLFNLQYHTKDIKKKQKNYYISPISKVFLAFQIQNKNQKLSQVQQLQQLKKKKIRTENKNQIKAGFKFSARLKSKRLIKNNRTQKKQNSIIFTYSLSRFQDIISNQIRQKYLHGQFDFCYPTLFQDGEKGIVKQNNDNKKQSEATDFILIGIWRNKYEINFFQVTVSPNIDQKLKNFGQLLSKIKQFYLPEPNFNSLFKIPIQYKFKINFFVVAASVSQNQLYEKSTIFKSASAKISDQTQRSIFKKNFQTYFGEVGVVNFTNKQNNSIQIINSGWIGTKTDVKNQEELVKKQNQQNQKKKHQNQKYFVPQNTKKFKIYKRTRKL